MTNFLELKTMGMSVQNDYEDDLEGLTEGFHVIEDGWDEAEDFEEEEYIDIPLPKITSNSKSKLHLLDRRDSGLYGGFLRYRFYKETGGKKVFNKADEQSCNSCESDLSVSSFKKEDFLKGSNFEDIYFKEVDSENRELSEIQLALLQLYDWIGVCSCGELKYGFFENETSLTNHLSNMVQKAKSLSEEIKNNREEVQESSRVLQMDLYDFLEEPV